MVTLIDSNINYLYKYLFFPNLSNNKKIITSVKILL